MSDSIEGQAPESQPPTPPAAPHSQEPFDEERMHIAHNVFRDLYGNCVDAGEIESSDEKLLDFIRKARQAQFDVRFVHPKGEWVPTDKQSEGYRLYRLFRAPDVTDLELLDWFAETRRNRVMLAYNPQTGKLLLQSWVAGILGIVSGGLLFFFWLGSHDTFGGFLVGLVGAGVMAFVIEWFREIIREGKGELEREPDLIPKAFLTFLTLAMLEVFVMASDHVAKMGSEIFSNTLRVFLGDKLAADLPPQFGLVGLAMVWIAMGITVIQGLSVTLLEADYSLKYRSNPIQFSLAQGFRSILASVGAMIAALLAFRLFVILSYPDAATSALDFASHALFRGLAIICIPTYVLVKTWHFICSPLSMGPELGLAVPAAIVVVPALVLILTLIGWGTGLPEGTSVFSTPHKNSWTSRLFEWVEQKLGGGWVEDKVTMMVMGLLAVLGLPLLLIGWKQVLLLMVVTAVYWLVPCLVLAVVIPKLRSLTRPPSARVIVAFVVTGIVLFAVAFVDRLAEYKLILVPTGLIFLTTGLIGFYVERRSEGFRKFWPVIPAVVAGLVFLSTVVFQKAVLMIVRDSHTLMSLSPPASQLQMYAQTFSDPLSPGEKDRTEKRLQVVHKRWRCVLLDASKFMAGDSSSETTDGRTPQQIEKAVTIVRRRFPTEFENGHVGDANAEITHSVAHETCGTDHQEHYIVAEAVNSFGELERLHRELTQLAGQFFELHGRLRSSESGGDRPLSLPMLITPEARREQEKKKEFHTFLQSLQPKSLPEPTNEPREERSESPRQIEGKLDLDDFPQLVNRHFLTLRELEKYKNSSSEEIRVLREKMAFYFHLCLAGGFAFWATLAFLAGWSE